MVMRALFLVLYSVITSTGFFGNCCIIAAIVKHKYLRNPVHVFLANVALSDLLFILLSTWSAAEFMTGVWSFGEVLCRFQGALLETSYTVSICSLTVVSIERHATICNPTRREQDVKKCIKWSVLIWVAAFTLCSPLFYGYGVSANEMDAMDCSNNWWSKTARLTYYCVHTVIVYIVPLILMIITHYKISRYLHGRYMLNKAVNNIPEHGGRKGRKLTEIFLVEKRSLQDKRALKRRYKNLKVIRILGVIVIVFFILWTPYMVARVLKYSGVNVNEIFWKGSHLLLLATCAVNFFIYAFISKGFRKAFRSLFTCYRNRHRNDTATSLILIESRQLINYTLTSKV